MTQLLCVRALGQNSIPKSIDHWIALREICRKSMGFSVGSPAYHTFPHDMKTGVQYCTMVYMSNPCLCCGLSWGFQRWLLLMPSIHSIWILSTLALAVANQEWEIMGYTLYPKKIGTQCRYQICWLEEPFVAFLQHHYPRGDLKCILEALPQKGCTLEPRCRNT